MGAVSGCLEWVGWVGAVGGCVCLMPALGGSAVPWAVLWGDGLGCGVEGGECRVWGGGCGVVGDSLSRHCRDDCEYGADEW